MNRPLLISILACLALLQAPAQETTRSPSTLLAALKQECEHPEAPDQPRWMSYLSATEVNRWRILLELARRKQEALQAVVAVKVTANTEYAQMLSVAAGYLGNTNAAIVELPELLTNSPSPAVRVCAARVLRELRQKSAIPALQTALLDPYQRVDGECDEGRNSLCYPVRIVAADALVVLGVNRQEINARMLQSPASGADGQR